MDLWSWVIAYVVGFSLLQVVIYRYLRDRGENRTSGPSNERIEHATPLREQWNAEGRPTVGDPSQNVDPLSVRPYARHEVPGEQAAMPHGRYCPRCGALNETDLAFTYCRVCVRPLG